MRYRKHIEQWLLRASIFLIPSNLAYHWKIDAAYINGRLIDYLLPKIYLSDLPIIILILFGIWDFIQRKNTLSRKHLIPLFFMSYLLINASFSSAPIPSLWYVLKIIEFFLFGSYLVYRYSLKQLFKLARVPLLLSILLQSSLSLYQYISHKSLIGYIFLGEPNLKSIGISQTNFFGLLEVAPYGTTPHPNVLAGFLGISSVLLLLSTHLSPPSRVEKDINLFFIGLSGIIITLTQSVSALSGLIVMGILGKTKYLLSERTYRVILLMCICGSLIFSLLFTHLNYHSSQLGDNLSITTRYELNQVAFSAIKSSFLTGIGPNIFSTYVPRQTFSGQRTLFLQPVHHIGLLIWSETGFLGVILLSWCVYAYSRRLKPGRQLYYLPLVGLLIIGSWDHYPLTLQTGQLLGTLALTIPLLRSQ